MTKPSIPKGTRDFSTEEMLRREYIFSTIKQVFTLFGYQPIETPAMENLSTLLGKYGDEGDKLLFKILNSGDYLADLPAGDLTNAQASSITSKIAEKGLRYDLTVPFARYVVQHRNEITFPFKRYQIQPVWRADRPQKGRYREFFQCDADVIGSNSLLNEYELIRIIDDIFSRLHISIIIKLNNRKILSGIADYTGNAEKLTDITVAIDKLDKIGLEAVNAELMGKGLSEKSVSGLQPLLQLKGSTHEKLGKLKEIFSGSVTGLQGIEEMTGLFRYIESGNILSEVELDLPLARGLNYYTGTIIEVKSKDVAIGSICGGGRYDNLTGVFGLEGVSGVGVSFGADRIYDVMSQLNYFSDVNIPSTEVLVVNFGENEAMYALNILDMLRRNNVRSELYPDAAKIKKQFSYADSKKIPYIIMAGADEIASKSFSVKIMETGEQKKLELKDLEAFIKTGIKKTEEDGGGIH